MKKQFDENDSLLKIERRKAASLERELDQFKFTSETQERNSKETLASFNEKVQHLKKEISSLENRLERQLKESQRKIEDERKISMEAIEKLRMMENMEENLKITIENLTKKVEFYKEKSIQNLNHRISPTKHHSHSQSQERSVERSLKKQQYKDSTQRQKQSNIKFPRPQPKINKHRLKTKIRE